MLSIILVNFNNSIDTINCLKLLQNQTYRNFEILLVDNNSKQTEKEKLQNFLNCSDLFEELKKKIILLYSHVNLGFTGGNNLGIKNSKGDIILLLNSDTYHNSDFLESMTKFFQKYKLLHIAQPKICFFPEKSLIWCNGGRINKYAITLFKSLDYMEIDKNQELKPFKIDYAAGAALFIRRNVLRNIGLLDNIYFMYCEETDLCYRAILEGYDNIFSIPSVKIYHNTHGKSKFYKKFYYRNRIIFCFKFFPLFLIFWQILMQILSILITVFNTQILKFDYDFLLKSLKGTIIGIKLGMKSRYSQNKTFF